MLPLCYAAPRVFEGRTAETFLLRPPLKMTYSIRGAEAEWSKARLVEEKIK